MYLADTSWVFFSSAWSLAGAEGKGSGAQRHRGTNRTVLFTMGQKRVGSAVVFHASLRGEGETRGFSSLV